MPAVHAVLEVLHVWPIGVIDFPNRSAPSRSRTFPATYSADRAFEVDLEELRRRQGEQVGHLYAVAIHSSRRALQFLDGVVVEVNAPDCESTSAIRLGNHPVLLGMWRHNWVGGRTFEHSGQVLGT
ncbi:hypothetical protein [Deinococcus hopiensis]|uniref:Uncharacterized protein n=1 Tax=Deinococcus hopiensis KR-140 TaxID=695939 RepID=A0A1W1UDK6_9DEIO|nr:hypothetical protein [Deinococcus hopiensis]SMB78854.1 hypothetical protein SAMN00790413_05660 [Deinococcus hopiensis KR-140]